MPFRFLDLPPEIRDHVYEHVFDPAANRCKDEDAYVRYCFSLALARTCRRMHAEAMRVFFKLNVFAAIETPWLQAQDHVEREGYVPLLIRRSDEAHAFRHHSLTVAIDAPMHADSFPFEAAQRVIIHADDLAAFADFWMYQDLSHPGLNQHMRLTLTLRNPNHSLQDTGKGEGGKKEGKDRKKRGGENEERTETNPRTATKKNTQLSTTTTTTTTTKSTKSTTSSGGDPAPSPPPPLSEALQRQLLEPFAVVRHLRGLVIEGEHSAEVERRLREGMARPYREAEDCLDAAAELRERGNAAFNGGAYREAVRLYEASFLQLHIVCDGRRRSVFGDAFFNADMRRGRFKGQNGALARLVMRVRLVASIVYAFLRLEDFERARFWGMRTIDLFRAEVEFGDDDLGVGILNNDGGGVNGDGGGGAGGANGGDGGVNAGAGGDGINNNNDDFDEDDDDDDDDDESALDFPAANDMGKIYFRTGVAYRRLGMRPEARRLLRTAMAYLPNDPDIRQEHASIVLELTASAAATTTTAAAATASTAATSTASTAATPTAATPTAATPTAATPTAATSPATSTATGTDVPASASVPAAISSPPTHR